MQKIISSLKYHGNSSLAFNMGERIASGVKLFFDLRDIDFIVPVPLYSKRRKNREYNQAEWISAGISSLWNIPVNNSVISRMGGTGSQSHIETVERINNIEQAFVIDDVREIEGKHIILVDDVLTSGSTISSCVQLLSGVSGIKINVLTFAFAHGI